MFEVIHRTDTTPSEHETEDDARKQVIGFYGSGVFIDDNDRPSGRLRVWTSEADAANDFGCPVAKILLEPEAKEEPAKKETTHHTKKKEKE